MSAKASQRIEIELPVEALAHHPGAPGQLAQEMRALWFLEQVRQRRLAFSKAAELSEIPLARFLELMGDHRITPFDYDSQDIEQEIRQDGQ